MLCSESLSLILKYSNYLLSERWSNLIWHLHSSLFLDRWCKPYLKLGSSRSLVAFGHITKSCAKVFAFSQIAIWDLCLFFFPISIHFSVSVANIIWFVWGQEVSGVQRGMRWLVAANAPLISGRYQKSLSIVPKWCQHLVVYLISSEKELSYCIIRQSLYQPWCIFLISLYRTCTVGRICFGSIWKPWLQTNQI